MKIARRIVSLPADLPLDRLAPDAASAGVAALDLPISPSGAIRFDSPIEDCVQVPKSAANAGLVIAALSVADDAGIHLTSSDAAIRRQAKDRVRAALERAAWLEAGILVLSPAGAAEAAPGGLSRQYEDVHRLALDALLSLRFDAEQRAVRIACLVGANRFLLTPPEAREFIDRANSAWVGACLDITLARVTANPLDWIRSLAGRIFHVYLAETEPDAADVMNTLNEVRYTGVVARP